MFSHGEIAIDASSMAFLGLVYIVWGFSLITLSRQINNGAYLYLLPFVGAWVSDSFAYFTGRLFGRHKLIPDVSPKKTVEGAVGGIVWSLICTTVLCFAFKKTEILVLMLIATVPFCIVGMCGDLFASVIKRSVDLKDYGTLIPGHGGIMDRLDSILMIAPLMFLSIGIGII
jgi:phosphatidate cytidylyltransferase